MNIGIVTTWYERGAAYVSKAYMDALSPAHNVFIYARGGTEYAIGDPLWDLPCVTWAPRYNGFLPGSGTRISPLHFRQWLTRNSIEVVIFNEQHDIGIVQKVAKMGYPVVAYVDYYTDDTVSDFWHYDCLLCNTRRHYSVFKDHPGAVFIQWGTDTGLFKPQAGPPLDAESDPVVFFHSAGWGGVNLRKGTDLLVSAFKHVRGNARLVIHSQAPIERYGPTADLIQEDDRVEFIHRTVTAPGLYHLGHVFVYPTRLEGIGLCVPEALACGLPVITTNEAPMNEFVEDGINGALVRVAERRKRGDGYYWPEAYVDTADLATKMQFYVDNRDALRQQRLNARASAEANFDWSKQAQGLSDLMIRIKSDLRKKIRRPGLSDYILWTAEHVMLSGQKHLLPPARLLRRGLRAVGCRR